MVDSRVTHSEHSLSTHVGPARAADDTVPLARRLLALLYDSIAVFTLVYFASFVPVLFNGGAVTPGNPLMTLYALMVMFGYFGRCWTRRSTLGMQAWKLDIVAGDGMRAPTWREAAVRFACAGALLGGGTALGWYVGVATGGGHGRYYLAFAGALLPYFAALLDRDRRTWPDRWSGTALRRRPLSARGGAGKATPPAAAPSDPGH